MTDADISDPDPEVLDLPEAVEPHPNMSFDEKHPYISKLQKSPVYVKGVVNVIDPLDCVTNLCRNMDLNGLHSFDSALKSGSRSLNQLCASSDIGMLKSAFQLTDAYIKENCSESPNSSIAGFSESNFEELEASAEIMELIVASVPSVGGLLRLMTYILEQRGVLPVGEIGKQLLEFTGSDLLVKSIKSKFGGLKKVIEMHLDIFSLGTEHPFNPLVRLLPDRKPIKYPISPVSVSYPSLAAESLLPGKTPVLKEVKVAKEPSSPIRGGAAISTDGGIGVEKANSSVTGTVAAEAPASPKLASKKTQSKHGGGKKSSLPSNRITRQYLQPATAVPYLMNMYPLYGFQPVDPSGGMIPPQYLPYPSVPYPMMYSPAPVVGAYGNAMIPPYYYNVPSTVSAEASEHQREDVEHNGEEQSDT